MTNTAAPSTDTKLAVLIQHVESSGFLFALRFEPEVYDGHNFAAPASAELIEKIKTANLCDTSTAEVIYSSSFGLYQIMGFNLYALGWRGSVVPFLDKPEYQSKYFALYLNSRGINWTWAEIKADPAKLQKFALEYNGNAAAYSQRMLAKAAELGM